MELNSKWTWIFIMNKTKLSCTQTNMIIYTVPKFLDVWSRRPFKSFWVRHQFSEASYQTQTVKIVENGLQNIEITIIFVFMVNDYKEFRFTYPNTMRSCSKENN